MNKHFLVLSLIALGLCFEAYAGTLRVKITDHRGEPVQGAVVSYTPVGDQAVQPSPRDDIVINQKNLQFTPFTTLAPVGSQVSFINEDHVLHHVFSFSRAKRFDLKLFGRDEPQSVTFENTGIVTVGCNIHDGMIAHIFIADAPYAGQSGADGLVALREIPAGAGQLVVWHPLMRQRDNRILREISLTDEIQDIDVSSNFRRGIRTSSDY